jgi:hypothetical protein
MEQDNYFGIDQGGDEFSHWGRLGMKWYQHIFTSLEEYNRKRAEKARAARAKNRETREQIREMKSEGKRTRKLNDAKRRIEQSEAKHRLKAETKNRHELEKAKAAIARKENKKKAKVEEKARRRKSALPKKRNVRKYGDAQLDEALTRLQKEKQYLDLLGVKQKKTGKKGEGVIAKVLKDAFNQTTGAVIKGTAYGIETSIKTVADTIQKESLHQQKMEHLKEEKKVKDKGKNKGKGK